MQICVDGKAGKDRKHSKGLIDLSEIGSESVDEGHIEHTEDWEDMLDPEGVISVMAKSKVCYNRGSENRNKSEGESHVKCNIIKMLIFLYKHKRGNIGGPLADLQGQKRHHLGAVLTVTHVQKPPIIGAFIKDKPRAYKGSEGVLVLPITEFFSESVYEEYAHAQKYYR